LDRKINAWRHYVPVPIEQEVIEEHPLDLLLASLEKALLTE